MIIDALKYVSKGLRVLPIYWPSPGGTGCGCIKSDCAAPAKHPCIVSGVKGATSDPERVRYYWHIWPDANIGIATGEGLAVVDVDDSRVVDVGKVKTRVAYTARGFHAYYRVDRPVANRVRVRGGVDIRGEGGYVIAPPSVHATGAVYEWRGQWSMQEAPAWLYSLLERPTSKRYGTRDDVFDVGRMGVISEGGRNDALFRCAAAAVGRGKNAVEVETEVRWINSNRCQPPLSDREVGKLIQSALRY